MAERKTQGGRGKVSETSRGKRGENNERHKEEIVRS